jgi:hypothetical protein
MVEESKMRARSSVVYVFQHKWIMSISEISYHTPLQASSKKLADLCPSSSENSNVLLNVMSLVLVSILGSMAFGLPPALLSAGLYLSRISAIHAYHGNI